MTSIEIKDVIILLQAFEKALASKIYTKEEAEKYFNSWNTLSSVIESWKRKELLDNMYKDT